MFGQTSPQPGSVFGQTGSQPGSLFGQNVSQIGSPSFGSPGASVIQPGTSMIGSAHGGFGTSQGTGSGFGPVSSTTNMFQQNPSSFGQGSVFSGAAGAFRQPQATAPSGTSMFGQGSAFSGAGGLGQPQAAASTGASMFGQGSVGAGGLGQSQATASTGVSMFGQGSAFAGEGGLGQPQATGATGASMFGQGSAFAGAGGLGQPQATTVTTSSVSLFGQGSAFSGAAAFGQPQATTTVTSLFGQKLATAGGFSPASTASPGLFGHTSPSPPRPLLFGQSLVAGQNTSTSTAALFGQPSFVSQTSSATAPTQASFAFGKTTASSSFGSGGASAFQSTASVPTAFGQSLSSAGSFGKLSSFSQQPNVASTGQPSAFGQPVTTAGLFGQPAQSFNQSAGFSQQPTAASGMVSQQTTATVTPFGQTSAFGQPASTTTGSTTIVSASTVGTGGGTFGTGGGTFATGGGTFGTVGGTFGTSSDVKPSVTGLFGKGPQQTGSGTATTTAQSRTRLVSGGFAGLFGKKETTGGPRESTESDQKSSLFGKPATGPTTVKQEPQSQARSLFGKGPPDYQDVVTSLVTVKQEKPQYTALFGKPAPSSEPEGATKQGLFGKGGGGSGHRQASTVEGGEADVSRFTGSTTRQEERQTVSQQPRGSLGLFGKVGTKPAPKGLFGKQSANDDSDRDTDESEGRGFRPRLARVREDPGSSRSLFGKPVTQSTRQSRGSDESLKARRGSVSRQMSEDRSRKVAIICKDVPTKFNNHMTLRNHFCRYGKVTKVFPNPAKMQATIHFERHEQAADAKRRGRVLARGYPPLTMFWSSYLAPLTPSPRGSSTEQGQGPASGTDDEVPGPSRRPAWRRGDAVNDELDTMLGTRDLSYDRKKSPSPGPGQVGSRSPEKRVRSASPTPGPATSTDIKLDKVIQMGSFLGLVAKTTTEKVHLLDLRDKYIRQNRKKSEKDIKKSFVGTCPDMCPEKERYDREDKRRLSYYEMVPGTENIPGRNPVVDHCRAVKEYLRSSPDQDEPLPHELRPLPVLQMTMTYLLCEIADQGQDGYWADWFDFLWNRTRGIRKEITQQQLCDKHATELIEKCARFHIFCSERLCEEDMHSFDAKINNENLTKCLQTLREFYHDLERKQKVFCPSEAEFRAYTVLMNLNEGDILREVQQLRPEVRNTPEINFALQVYSALNSNNYVRFFRLVKKSSFSCACIMHRYFTQVRNRALTSMMRTYGMGNKPAQIPLSELVRLLGFESEQEASDFSEHYGFIVEDACVVLDKNDYVEPDTAWLLRRSVHLIESKRVVSVGEMINGDVLPSLNLLQPSSSFDEQGRFKSAVELPRRATATEVVQQVPEAEVRGHPEVKQEPVAKAVKLEPSVAPQPQKPSFTNEHVKDTAKLLFWEVIDEMCQEIGREHIDEIQTLLDVGQAVLENTVYSTVTDIIQSLSREVLDDVQAEHRRVLKQEREARCDRVAEVLKEEFLEDTLKEQVLNLATIEIREVKAQLKRECIERTTEEINRELIQEVMSEMVQECATNVYETDVIQRLRQLQELEGIVKLSRAGKFFKRWKKEYVAVTKLKRAMMDFPSAPSMETTGSQLDCLVPNRKDDIVSESGFYVNQTARLTVETPVQVEERRRRMGIKTTIQSLYQKLMYTRAWLPLDLTKLVGTKLAEKYRRHQKGSAKVHHLYWKLVMYPPEVDPASASQESRATALLCDWLRAKLSKGKKPPPETVLKTEVLSLYKAKVAPQTSSSSPVTLGVCVRSISGLPSEDELLLLDEERCMLGTSGIIFVLPANPPVDDPYSEYWYTNVQRLQELLEVKPSNQDFPLVIIVAASANQDVSYNSLSERLNLDQFIEQGFICDVKVVVVDYDDSVHQGIDVVDPQVSEKLCECMEWLSDLTNISPDLTVSYLKDSLDGVLLEHYYTPVLQNLRKRKTLGHLHQGPEELLELYNAVIQHLCDTVTSESLLNLSWPVAEFTRHDESSTPPPHWNTEDQFEYLSQLIGSLKLPQLVPCLSEPRSWEEVREKVFSYVNSVVDRQSGPARITLFSRLNKLLKQVEMEFEDTCYLTEGLDSCEPMFNSVPWTDLVSVCIDYRLATLDFLDPCLNTQGGHDEEIKVAYFQSEFENFVPPYAWRHVESDQSILESQSVKGMIQTAAKKVRENLSDTTLKVATIVNQENVPPEPKETKTSSSLIKSLQAERRRSDHFQKFLENALKSDQNSVSFKELPSEISYQKPELNSAKPKLLGDLFRNPAVQNNCTDKDSLVGFQESEWKSASAAMFGDSLAGPTAENREFSMIENDLNVSMGTRLFGNRTIHFNDESCFGDGDQVSSERKRKSFGHIPQNAKRFSLSVAKEADLTNRESLAESQLPVDITALSSKVRKQRLSDIYGNDKVMFALCEPSVDEGIDSLKNQIKANRRESDLFEEKLLAAMKADPFTT